MPEKTVRIYVRLGPKDDEDTRTLSFSPPEELSQKQLLDWGWAIDGNEAVKVVPLNGYDAELVGDLVATGSGLAAEERYIAGYLGKLGYEVKFE